MNRQQIDSFAPSTDVWLKINAGMQKAPFIKSKVSWLKYFAYSASAILAVAGLYALLNKNDSVSSLTAAKATTATAGLPVPATTEIHVTEPTITGNNNATETPVPIEQSDEITGTISPVTAASVPMEMPLQGPEEVSDKSSATPPLQPAYAYGGKTTIHNIKKDSLFVDTTFSGISALELTVSSCNVNVNPSNTSMLHFKADITTKAHGIIIGKSGYHIVYERQDSLLKIHLENTAPHILIAGTYIQQAMIDLDLPDNITLLIKNSYGDLIMNGVKSKTCKLVTSSGNLTIKNGSGTTELNSSYGDVAISDLVGAATVTTASGDVRISNLTGTSKIKASYGSVVLKSITGDVTINAVSGNVNISGMSGNLDVISEYGDITLQDYKGTPKLISSSGNITGKNVELKEGMTTKSNYGDVSMSLLNDYADLSFDLSAIYGEISVAKGAQQIKDKNKVFIKQGNILIKGSSNSGDQTYR